MTHDNTGFFTAARQPFSFFSCGPLPLMVVVSYNFVRKRRCSNSLDKHSATLNSVPAGQQVEGKHQMSIQQAAQQIVLTGLSLCETGTQLKAFILIVSTKRKKTR